VFTAGHIQEQGPSSCNDYARLQASSTDSHVITESISRPFIYNPRHRFYFSYFPLLTSCSLFFHFVTHFAFLTNATTRVQLIFLFIECYVRRKAVTGYYNNTLHVFLFYIRCCLCECKRHNVPNNACHFVIYKRQTCVVEQEKAFL
jgi:hypothetical protein